MLSLIQLSSAIADYRNGSISIDSFEDWFRDNSRGMFGENERTIAACLAVEAAFSRIRFDDATEIEFQQDLAKAIPSFEYADANVFLRIKRGSEKAGPEASASARPSTIAWGLNGGASTPVSSSAASLR